MAYVATFDCGTWKSIVPNLVDDSWDCTGASTRTITCTTSVPAGTRGISGYCILTGTVAGYALAIRTYGGSANHGLGFVAVASVASSVPFNVALDDSYRFDLYGNSSTISDVDTWITGVYI